MGTLVVDLTDITRIEFEVLRIKFPIEDGEPIPAVESVLNTLLVHAVMLGRVIEDPAMKPKLGMEGLEAPRRHQRKIVAACMSLVGKLQRYRSNQYLLLMNLVGLSNRLVKTEGESTIDTVFGMFKTPISVSSKFLIPSKPREAMHNEMVDAVDRLVEPINGEPGTFFQKR